MRILITGGAGAWGTELCRFLLNRGDTVCVYSRDEEKQRKLSALLGPNVRCFIGDVQDQDRLSRAMDYCDRVIHFAAMKQIDACTYNPIEAVRINVDGTISVIECALDHKIHRVLCMSTDKAVEPTTLYGQTKAVVEGLVRNAASYGHTHFVALRCGNAWGSTGSVVPLFRAMAALGAKELPVTHPECTRFTIGLRDTAPMVMDALERDVPNGSILAPCLNSYAITDLVEAFGCTPKIVGLRPGEKIHEAMVGAHEALVDGVIQPGRDPVQSCDVARHPVETLREMIHA